LHELAAREAAERVAQKGGDAEEVRGEAVGAADQDEAVDAAGVVDGEPLGDDAAEGEAEDVDAVELEVVEELGDVGGVVGEGAGLAPGDGAAEAAVVHQDEGEVGGEDGDEGVPGAAMATEPGDKQQGLTLPVEFVITANIGQFRPRHIQPRAYYTVT
jgi:hypothetical protein